MTAKIIIDRKVKKGSVSEFLKLLEELRGKAVSAKGYISGETLQASDDPHNLIVVSTWHSVEEWKNWEKNSERQEIQATLPRHACKLGHAQRAVGVAGMDVQITPVPARLRTHRRAREPGLMVNL